MLSKFNFTPSGFLIVLLISACGGKRNAENIKHNYEQKAIDTGAKSKSAPAAEMIPDLDPVKDTGQQFFRVAIWKNSVLLCSYEGDWPIAAFDGENFNLQMAASERMLKISHLLVLYFNSPAIGSFPIAESGNEKGKPTLIFTPEKDGNYGIGIAAEEGQVVISSYSDKKLSGSLTAKGKDETGSEVVIKASFINIKNNNLAVE